MNCVTLAEETRSRAALLAVTQQSYRANELALKWGRHWRSLVKSRARRPTASVLVRSDKENRRDVLITNTRSAKSSFGETPKFYEGFKSLRNNRPAPRIPNFIAHNHF